MSEHTVGEIRDMYDLETMGDAWELVMDKEIDGEWTVHKPEGEPWVISIPEGQNDTGNTTPRR